ncbi:AMP-binding protein [Aristophania vespae]|uniref:AMP-binding protein n=1 Tax=Aristophania vespae TaxID=2697033 RepID=A0A6P1NCV8_9PROT|nr:AMP-binding protein [Aristophania vespae]QHI96156.1 AMP-binding protein [Aristophania vespae]UMM63943.1 Putative fatty-acid--CoA ligase fadD25 [Aristophania vespae]
MNKIEDYHLYRHKDGRLLLDWKSSTLDEMLSYRALITPDFKQFSYIGDGENVTQDMTLAQAHEWACRVAGLIARFAPERSHIVLCFENGLEAIAGFFGCVYANMIPISGIYPTAPESVTRLVDILEDSQAVAVIGLRQTLLDFRRTMPKGAPAVKWIPIEGAEKTEPLYRHHAADMHDVAFVQYTSGSVGRPRGVQITHSNLGYNLFLMLGRIGFYDGALGVSWLPLSHDMGLITGLLVGLTAGGPCMLMSPFHFIEKPERWLKIISRYRVSFTASPNFAYDLCTRTVSEDTLKTLDLSCWWRSLIGAEMIECDTVEGFIDRFSSVGVSKKLIHSGYGMAETTLGFASGGQHVAVQEKRGDSVVTFKAFSRAGLTKGLVIPPKDESDQRVLANCGMALEGHKIAVVDPETGEDLGEDRVGELWLSGPSISPGYLNREQENKERFNLPLKGDFYFRSRDTGFIHQGNLYVTGRLENRLLIGGRRFDPDDLASVIRQKCPQFTVRGLAIFWDDQALCVLGEISSSAISDQKFTLIKNMARAIKQICPVKALKIVLVRTGGISRTPSGKIRLMATQEAFKQKTLPIIEEQHFSTEELEALNILDLPSVTL